MVGQHALVDDVVKSIRLGHHCLIEGPELVGKTPILRAIASRLNGLEMGVTAVLCDLDFAVSPSVSSWQCLFSAIAERVLKAMHLEGACLEVQGDSLVGFLREAMLMNQGISRLAVIFDHVDHLPSDYMRTFARQCSALLNGPSAPLDRVCILWCGDTKMLTDPIANSNVGQRLKRRYTIAGYTCEQTMAVACHYFESFEHTLDEDALREIWHQTGGHPSLVRPYAHGYTSRLVERLQRPAFRGTGADAAKAEAESYVEDLLSAAGECSVRADPGDQMRSTGIHRIAGALVERVSSDVRLLDVMRLFADRQEPLAETELKSVALRNADLLLWDDARSQLRFRGRILHQFLCSWFSLERLGWYYLLLDSARDYFDYGTGCFRALRKSSDECGAVALRTGVDRRTYHEFLMRLAVHMHTISDPIDVLERLVQVVVDVLGYSMCRAIKVTEGHCLIAKELGRVNSLARRDVDEEACLSSFALEEAIRTDTLCSQNGGRQLAIPLTLVKGTGYVLWVEGYGDVTPDPQALGSLARTVEGPLVGAIDRRGLAEILRRRDEEVELLSGLGSVATHDNHPLDRVSSGIVSLLSALGCKCTIQWQSPVFGGERRWSSHVGELPVKMSACAQARASDDQYWRELAEDGCDVYYFALSERGERIGTGIIDFGSGQGGREVSRDVLLDLPKWLSIALLGAWELGRGQVHRFILNSLPIGIQVLDPDFRIIEMNDALQRQLRERDRYEGQWQGRECWRVHRHHEQVDRCEHCTAALAIEMREPQRRIEAWQHRVLGDRKELWHSVLSRAQFDRDGQPICVVEISRPLYVGEVFQYLSEDVKPGLFEEGDPQRVMEMICQGALILGFDRARLYWQDPLRDVLVGRAWAGHEGPHASGGLRSLSLALGPKLRYSDTYEEVWKGKAVILCRSGHHRGSDVAGAVTITTDEFPFEQKLSSSDVEMIAVAPLQGPRGINGSIAVDFKFTGLPITEGHVRALQTYGFLAGSVIHAAVTQRSLTEFASTAAHNLKEPIGLLGAHADALYESAPRNEVNDRHHLLLCGEFIRMARQGDDVVAISWGEQADQHMRQQPVDLVEILGHVVDLATDGAGRRDVALHFEPGPQSAPFRGSRDMLVQAFLNLLHNALEELQTEAPSPCARAIHFEFTEGEEVYEIRMIDTGRGVPLEMREMIWEDFFSMSGRHGLGLPSARAIIRAHGGSVVLCDSETEHRPDGHYPCCESCGSCFLIRLPKQKTSSTC